MENQELALNFGVFFFPQDEQLVYSGKSSLLELNGSIALIKILQRKNLLVFFSQIHRIRAKILSELLDN